MHQALYRKWRPQTFDDVYGQDHITSVLKYEIDNSKLSHAYLFCGSRGTGKTSCAKILAKAVNCESPINGNPCNKCASCLSIDSGIATDVLEMDAASNNGVENIRDIRDEVVYSPSSLKYRVYIVDEVHMLSGSAFNALLKTLEEPPAHVVFILATTELHKLPSTIISRCQRFDFRRITISDIMARLALIANNEGITADNDALRMIAKYAQGGMRDAISLFELCAGNKNTLDVDSVIGTIGSSGVETIAKVISAISENDYDAIFSIVDKIITSSRDISVFWNDLISYCRNMLICKTVTSPEKFLDLTESEKKQLVELTGMFTKESILYFIRVLNDSLYLMQKVGAAKRNIAEMTLIRMCDESLDQSADAMLSRISKLEAMIVGANISFTPSNIKEDRAEHQNKEANKVSVDSKTEKKLDAPKDSSKAENVPQENIVSEKIMRGWPEIIDRISAGDPSVSACMKMSRAYILSDGRISVRFNNPFALSIFTKSNLLPVLCNNIGASLKRAIGENDIECIVSQGKIEDDDDFDDIEQ